MSVLKEVLLGYYCEEFGKSGIVKEYFYHPIKSPLGKGNLSRYSRPPGGHSDHPCANLTAVSNYVVFSLLSDL